MNGTKRLSQRLGYRISFALLLWALLTGVAPANSVPMASPEESGFSAERLSAIDRFYQSKVDNNEMAGMVLLIARHGKIVHLKAIGYADTDTGRKMQPDSIFRLYSMTKPIAATALMTLYEEGKFQLDEPISKYIPEFKDVRVLRSPNSPITDTVPAVREPTIHDLLRFTDGFVHGLSAAESPLDAAYQQAHVFDLDVSLEEMTKRIAKLPLAYQPGKALGYSVAPDIEARLVEVFSGRSFRDFLQARLFGPLGMSDSGFWVQPEKAERLVSVHWTKNGKVVPMGSKYGYPKPEHFLYEPWSVNSYTKVNAHTGGSFGLVGTAEDYWRFAQMMADGGIFQGHRILGPNTVRYMAQDHRSFLFEDQAPENAGGVGWGLGFAVMNNSAKAGMMSSPGTFFWHGAAATTFWIDPVKDMVVVVMTQHMGSEKSDLGVLVPEIRTWVYSALLN